MRTVIVFAVLGLSLGLAAQMLPRVLERDASVVSAGGTRIPESWKPVASASLPEEEASITAHGVSGKREAASSGGAAPATPEQAEEEQFEASPPNGGSNEDMLRTIERLTAAGFTTRRARELLIREAELRREAINAEYAATGTIQPLGGPARFQVGQRLRKELGDDLYETYREAIGQPTRVRVADVEAGSAASSAGLLSGDEILSYAGQRIFDLGELSAMSLRTSIGETVPMAVVRDGQRLQLYVTGGPLGISQRSFR